jgi:regulator of sigma E protease
MLDGGHLAYYAIETVLGKPLGQQAQEWGFRLGLSLVAMLMAFGFWNDLTRLFAMMVGS